MMYISTSFKPKNYRFWLNTDKSATILNLEFVPLSLRFGIGINRHCEGYTFHIALLAFSLYISTGFWGSTKSRSLSLDVHSRRIWWKFWADDMSWESTRPFWKDGSFCIFPSFRFRKPKETTHEQE